MLKAIKDLKMMNFQLSLKLRNYYSSQTSMQSNEVGLGKKKSPLIEFGAAVTVESGVPPDMKSFQSQCIDMWHAYSTSKQADQHQAPSQNPQDVTDRMVEAVIMTTFPLAKSSLTTENMKSTEVLTLGAISLSMH